MKRSSKDKHFLKQPVYKGGKEAMSKLIKQALIYPKLALKNKTEGSVYLRYEIDYKGKVGDVKVLSSLGDGCDKEAIRVVKLFRFDIPSIPRNLKVTFHKNIRIHFALPQNSISGINYKIKNQKDSRKKEKTSSGYSYTINW